MGGAGSGCLGGQRQLAWEEYPRLDLRLLPKPIRADSAWTINWNGWAGEPVIQARISCDGVSFRIHASVYVDGVDVSGTHRNWLSQTYSPVGGWRHWLVCPICKHRRRVLALLWPDTRTPWACQKCAGAPYTCQQN